MAVIKQEDARDDLKRKSKKRKKRDALGGEDGNIQIDDKGHRKKKKETLVGTNTSEVATDLYSNFGAKNSRKEKEEIRTNRIKKEEVTDSKMEKKKKKNKTGVEGGASQAEIVSEEIEPMEDRNKKKKKKAAAEDEVNDSSGSEKMKKRNKSGDGGVSRAEDVSEEVEPVEDRKREKKKKKAEDKVNDRKMMKNNKSGDEGGASLVEDVSEEVKPMEDRKREKKKKKKKKAEEDSRAGYSEKEFLNNSDEHSINSGEDDGATGRKRKKETPFRSTLGGTRAGASEAEGNGAADHTLFVENLNEKIKSVKVKKRKNKKKDDLGVGSSDEELVTNTSVPSISNGKSSRDRSSKKKKFIGSNPEGEGKTGALKTSKMKNPIESCERSTPGKKSKVVRFSDRVEFLSLADNSRGTEKLKDHSKGKKKVGRLRRGKVSSKAEHQIVENSELNHKENNQTKKVDDGLIRGKRFSKEEDEIVKNSVLNYIERHQLGEMGLEMVLKCSNYPEVRDCWREIGEALPSRPYLSVYNRAHILFERSESRQWTPEEIEFVKEFHKKYGPDWKTLADELGKHRIHVKDTWRRIRYTNMKKGHWSQDEYESLFDLVNTDLKLKAFEEKRSKHGMLRDNISWEAIGDRLSTRGYALCCQKWYDQLTSPMVAEGIWADVDDYRLIIALDELDAACLEDVDWDNLLEHRPGDVCRKRWNQMVRNIGEHGTKSFGEQVEILSKRYCPDLLDARVAYDSKTPVD